VAQTYYEVLGVAENATRAEIEAAFKGKAREVHPDKVPPGNTYLRRVVGEAFKDLSEAKAVLLDPVERRKYDAELAYIRGSDTHTTPQSTPAAAPPPPPPQPPSSRAAPPPQQMQKYSFWEPKNSKFTVGTLMALAVGGVVLLVGIAGSEQAACLGLAFIAAAFGLLCWRHGRRPMTDAAYLGGSVFLFIFAIILLYGGLQSTPSVTKLTAPSLTSSAVAIAPPQTNPYRTPDAKPDRGKSSGHASAPAKRLQRAPSGPRSDSDPVLAVIDGAGENASNTNPTVNAESKAPSGTGLQYVTKTWKSLRDGQIYRTHSKADILYLTSADNYQNRIGDFTSCEFQRAVSPGLSWTGFCWVRNPKDQSTYRSPAILTTFSENRIEGSTTYISSFAMVPAADAQQSSNIANGIQIGNPLPTQPTSKPSPETNSSDPKKVIGRENVNSLSSGERSSIESACSYAKRVQGPAAYYRCLDNQLSALATAPGRPDLSGLTTSEQYSIESACSYAKRMQGPSSYYRCLEGQLDALAKTPRRPDLSGLTTSEQYSIESACAYAKRMQGPSSYYRCLANQLDSLKKYRQ